MPREGELAPNADKSSVGLLDKKAVMAWALLGDSIDKNSLGSLGGESADVASVAVVVVAGCFDDVDMEGNVWRGADVDAAVVDDGGDGIVAKRDSAPLGLYESDF